MHAQTVCTRPLNKQERRVWPGDEARFAHINELPIKMVLHVIIIILCLKINCIANADHMCP